MEHIFIYIATKLYYICICLFVDRLVSGNWKVALLRLRELLLVCFCKFYLISYLKSTVATLVFKSPAVQR